MKIALKGVSIEKKNIPPRNLVFLLDVSGSMLTADKLPLVKQGLKLLLGELTEKIKFPRSLRWCKRTCSSSNWR